MGGSSGIVLGPFFTCRPSCRQVGKPATRVAPGLGDAMSITLCQLYCLNLAIAARWFLNVSLWPLSRARLSSSIALLAICFACSIFIIVLLFRGVLAPFRTGRGSNDPERRTTAKGLLSPGRNGWHA